MNSRVYVACACVIALTGFQTAQQRHPGFEVASVRSNKSASPPYSNFPLNAGGMYTRVGDRFSATNFPLITYIAFAYDLLGNQIHALEPQLPGWAMTDGFDVEARASGNSTKDDMRLMMRSLLAERFRFAIHTETRTVPVLALVLARPGRPGPQLRPHPADAPCQPDLSTARRAPDNIFKSVPGGFPAICNGILGVAPSAPGRSRLGGRNVTIAFMADMFSQRTNPGRPMIDATGLKGTFDFLIEFAPPQEAASAQNPDGPTFEEALREQLGLKMERRRSEMPVMVVDHVERPSAN